MITIKKQIVKTESDLQDFISDKMSKNTCKTNLNPQLLFKQSYTGLTDKVFVGNWTKNGFWITKFRLQLSQFRPDIIANFRFKTEGKYQHINIRYSIGFSSLIIGLWLIFMFSFLFAAFSITTYITGLGALIALYILMIRMELKVIINKINETIFERVRKY